MHGCELAIKRHGWTARRFLASCARISTPRWRAVVRFRLNAKPTAFHVAAGQQVRVTLSVFPGVVRRLAAGRVRQVACSVLVTGTDDEGEPISNGCPYTSFVLTR